VGAGVMTGSDVGRCCWDCVAGKEELMMLNEAADAASLMGATRKCREGSCNGTMEPLLTLNAGAGHHCCSGPAATKGCCGCAGGGRGGAVVGWRGGAWGCAGG
jgi:hypothetical protein